MKGSKIVIIFLTFILLSQTASAYSWDNEINVRSDSMDWKYTETYSGNRSVLFKILIDSEIGNDDDFVSAWELLKVDVRSRKTFFDSISKEIDVGINNSSDSISILSVESSLSPELVGPVISPRDIVNIYEVYYSFNGTLPSNGSMWFRGEPASNVTIILPESFNITGSHGIDNIIMDEDSDFSISGTFGSKGRITVEFAENVSYAVEDGLPEPMTTPTVSEDASTERKPSSLMDDIFPGFTDGLARKLKSGLKV